MQPGRSAQAGRPAAGSKQVAAGWVREKAVAAGKAGCRHGTARTHSRRVTQQLQGSPADDQHPHLQQARQGSAGWRLSHIGGGGRRGHGEAACRPPAVWRGQAALAPHPGLSRLSGVAGVDARAAAASMRPCSRPMRSPNGPLDERSQHAGICTAGHRKAHLLNAIAGHSVGCPWAVQAPGTARLKPARDGSSQERCEIGVCVLSTRPPLFWDGGTSFGGTAVPEKVSDQTPHRSTQTQLVHCHQTSCTGLRLEDPVGPPLQVASPQQKSSGGAASPVASSGSSADRKSPHQRRRL